MAKYFKVKSADEASCLRKRNGFRSERIALIKAQLVANRHGVALGVYQCLNCKLWHLTSNPNRRITRLIVRPQAPMVAEMFDLIHG